MKTFEQFTIREAQFNSADDLIDDLANKKNSAIDMWLSPNKKDKLFSLYKSGKKITIWKGSPGKIEAKFKEMESKGFTLYAYENNYGQVEAVFYK